MTLRQRREALGLSQAELAELLGLSLVTVHRNETGRRADGAPVPYSRVYDLALEAIERRKADGTALGLKPRTVQAP